MSKNIRNCSQSIINISTESTIITTLAEGSDDTTTLIYGLTASGPMSWISNALLNLFPPFVANIQCERIGNICHVHLDGFQSSSTGNNDYIFSVTALPIYMRPPETRYCTIQVLSNGAVWGTIGIDNGGMMQVGPNSIGGSGLFDDANNRFASIGENNGIISSSFSYLI